MRYLTAMLFAAGLMLAQDATRPEVLSKVEPGYTEEAREAKVEGKIIMDLTITADGIPANLRVVQALGHGLDEKAVQALSQWKFKPATRDGKPVATTAQIDLNFQLK